MNALVDEVKRAIENLEIERIEALARQSLEEGIDPVEVIRSGFMMKNYNCPDWLELIKPSWSKNYPILLL